MISFYHAVDLRSRSAMTDFLAQHFRYFTMNAWNRSQSYACNLKLYNLGLEREIENKLYDLMDTQAFFNARNDLLDEFGRKHQYQWQAAMNGRSGGYLVLYQSELKPSGYKSYCTHCGQKNYSLVKKTGNICGVCRNPSRVDYSNPHMSVSIFPGRGTDDGEDFGEWTMHELKERVRLVQELDKLADRLVQKAVYLAENFTVKDERYFIPQVRKVLVPAGA